MGQISESIIREYTRDRFNEPIIPRPVKEEDFYKLKNKGYVQGTYEEYLERVQDKLSYLKRS